uniref:EBP like n=1 Tax=Terrapene triunguis TaxID=2587831 RepID=A0A674IC36_9SAUR
GGAPPPLLSAAAAGSLAVCAVQLGLAWALGRRLGGRCAPADRWVLGWLCYDVLVHCTLVSAGPGRGPGQPALGKAQGGREWPGP